MKKRLEYLKSQGYKIEESKDSFIAKGKHLTFKNNEKGFIVEKDPKYSWGNVTIKKDLAALNISYNNGLFAILIEERKMNRPLYILGMEDDDRIAFERYDKTQWETSFDMGWTGDLVSVINKAHELVWSKESK